MEPKPPTNLSMKLPPDVSALLHRTAYETGRSKLDLVTDAIRITYGSTTTEEGKS